MHTINTEAVNFSSCHPVRELLYTAIYNSAFGIMTIGHGDILTLDGIPQPVTTAMTCMDGDRSVLHEWIVLDTDIVFKLY